uniref:S-layer family protein n=1 Tax=Sphingopyxis sp. KK2 TaxID=1855727 RepID=UPI00097E5E85
VRLGVNGGTLTSNSNPVAIVAGGTSGNTGTGGAGDGGSLGDGGSFVDQGGTVIFEAFGSPGSTGTMSFGDVDIDASGFLAGRIDIRSAGTIAMTSLTATAQGSSQPTNNDTDLATTGIFLGITDGGLIQTDGAVSLDTSGTNGNSGASVGVYAQGDGQLNVGGTLTVNAGDQVDIRHDFRTGTAPTIQTGSSANFTAVTTIRSAPGSLVSAGTSLFMNATGLNGAIDVDSLDAADLTLLLAANGRINVYGTSTSGTDLTANARDEVAINDATAGDDISLIGGTVVAGNLITNGTGLDSELDGSSIFVGTTGAASVDHAEADNDFTADVGSFTTGPNSIITGGDIDITSVGAVDLGNSDAGGFVAVSGQSILFDTITAGTTVDLDATGTAPGAEGILGNSITAGGNVDLFGNTIRINDGVTTSASLFAFTNGGNARLSGTVDGDIIIRSAGDIAGTFAAGGNVSLTADTNITAQATAAGTYVGPNGPSEGYLFLHAAGDANLLAGSSAATMIGIGAGTNANVDGATAGEDLYVSAGNTATVTNSLAGDDLIVSGTCCVIVDNVSTTGAGPDGRSMIFAPGSAGGPNIWQIQTGPTDLSNIVLTASAGTIDASNAVAFDNLTATASDVVTTTNTIRSGLVTTITGSSLDLESVTAGTDIVLTSTSGDISAIGALSAGHDLTISSAANGIFADLAAGDDIRITASGDVSAASLLTTAGGADNEADNSGAYIDTPGSITIAGTTSTVGQTRLTAGGTVDAGAINADYTFIDADGAVTLTGDVTSGGMYIEGSSVAMQSGFGNLGQIVLRATAGGVTANGDVLTGADLTVGATGAIAITGTANGGNLVEMTGGSIDVADVGSNTYISLTSTSGAINSTGTIAAGSDAIINAATGGQFNAITAGDDVSITAGGNITIASITAEGSNPQGEEIGSNVSGTITGLLTVTGSTFANDDVNFSATSMSLQDVTAGGSFTATTSGGPLTLTSADVANNITLTSARDVVATGLLQSGGDTTATGRNLDLASIAADGDVDLTATVGTIATGGNVSGVNVTFDAVGDIDHGIDNLLSASNNLTLTAGGNIAVGDAGAGSDLTLTANGAIDAGALTAGRAAQLAAGDAVNLTGDLTATLVASITGRSVELNDIAVVAGSLGIDASGGGVHSTGTFDINGQMFVTAAGAIELTGDIDAAAIVDIRGSAVTVGDLTGGSFVGLTATNGAVNSAGTISAGSDINITTTQGGTFNRLLAGDDIGIGGSGDVGIAFMDATGDNPQGEEEGSNVGITLVGNVTVGHGEAAGDYVVDATSFTTGLNSLIVDGDIDITTTGASNLGNSTAGGSISVDAQSIAFNTLNAGNLVQLSANGFSTGAEGISGGGIVAGFDVILSGNSIDIGSVDAGGLLSAFGSGGDVAIDDASAVNGIGVVAAGNIAGAFTAGGDIEMSAGGDITVAANAAGGAPDPSNGDLPAAGNLFIDAGGDVVLTNSGAAGMLGINAGGAAALTNVTAGEDLLVRTGGFGGTINPILPIAGENGVSLTNVTAGDDFEIRSVGNITAVNARATGQGPDSLTLDYGPNGFTIGQGEGTSAVNGADIFMTSSDGSIDATGLRAGDDIVLFAATTIGLNGATTLGVGNTAGGSNISANAGGNATLADIDAFNDLIVNAGGIAQFTDVATAGRDIRINAGSVDLIDIVLSNGTPVDILDAGRNLTVTASGTISGGSVNADNDMTLSAGEQLFIRRAATGTGGAMSLDGALGVTVETLLSGGTTTIDADGGEIRLGTVASAGPIALTGDSIFVNALAGTAVFSTIETDVGDAFIFGGDNVSVTTGSVAGRALISSDGSLSVTQLSGNEVELGANTTMTLGNVTATTALGAQARGLLTVNGAIVGRSMIIASGDITIGSAGRLGTPGTTQALEVRNIDEDSVTYIGGTGTRDGYHIDQTEMTRLFAGDITILAPDLGGNNGGFVAAAPGGSPIATVGSRTPPAVVIDDFTLTAGGPTSNLGASGSLTIATQGKARVIGDAAITGMTDANAFRIFADEAIEVILGEGTIRLSGSSPSTPAGNLILRSEDVIVATADAIADVGAATTTDEIDDRLAENDGILLDDGALFAGGMDVTVEGGFYVQNSGEGTRFAQRRGLTFGPGGLNINVAGADSRIVINGVHLGSAGQVTGLDAIPLLSINGFVIGSGPLAGSGLAFDSASTMNGCLIVSSTTCAFLEFESSFPVQDVINKEDDDEGEGDDAEGMSLPIPLITMRDLDPLTGEPLLDDPVTGAGNDDLWTPPSE